MVGYHRAPAKSAAEIDPVPVGFAAGNRRGFRLIPICDRRARHESGSAAEGERHQLSCHLGIPWFEVFSGLAIL
jgi:hypothetical protein